MNIGDLTINEIERIYMALTVRKGYFVYRHALMGEKMYSDEIELFDNLLYKIETICQKSHLSKSGGVICLKRNALT